MAAKEVLKHAPDAVKMPQVTGRSVRGAGEALKLLARLPYDEPLFDTDGVSPLPYITNEILIRAGGVYPFRSTSRYGFTHAPVPGLADKLCQDEALILQTLGMIGAAAEGYGRIATEQADETAPFYGNGYVDGFNAISLYGMIAGHKPARYVEVGSGNSTKFARQAISDHGLDTRITSIDPQPRAEIDILCDDVVRSRFEDVDGALFTDLEAGDILFFDGSHRVFPNSDVTAFYLEILPALKPGVIVCIDDIFLPRDYPAHWENRLYSEQYMLAAMLAYGWRYFDFLLPCNFAAYTEPFAAEVARVCAPVGAGSANAASGFWMCKRVEPKADQAFVAVSG